MKRRVTLTDARDPFIGAQDDRPLSNRLQAGDPRPAASGHRYDRFARRMRRGLANGCQRVSATCDRVRKTSTKRVPRASRQPIMGYRIFSTGKTDSIHGRTFAQPIQRVIRIARSLAGRTQRSRGIGPEGEPHIPDVVLALRKELTRPEPELRVVAELIAQDPAITGDLLKAINSPIFNLRSKVTSVHQAAAMIGVQRLTNYVTAVAVKRMVEAMDARVHGVWEDILEEARVIVAVSVPRKGSAMTRPICSDCCTMSAA